MNKVTPVLFARYPTPAALAAADADDVERIIKSTGYYRSKTRSLIGMANGLVERFGGAVPNTMEDLETLPGWVARPRMLFSGTRSGRTSGSWLTRMSHG